MKRKSEWETFFNWHAPKYMDDVYTKNTAEEVDFIIDQLGLKPGAVILDVGCGTGRHAVGLAKKGYNVTGIDLSSGMLAEARRAVEEAEVKVELLHVDAVKYKPRRRFDGAICLCEGAFGLLGSTDDPREHDFKILCNVNAALRRGSRLILTTLNGYKMAREYDRKDVEQGRFDPVTMVETSKIEYNTRKDKKSVVVKQRGYVPSELTILFSQAGFRVEHIWGGTAGKWHRQTLDLDEMEIMVVAKRIHEI